MDDTQIAMPSATTTQAKVALIVGATGGIGQACAQALYRDGWQLALGYRNQRDTAKALATSLSADAMSVCIDVTDPASVQSAINEAESNLGPLSCVVMAAGPYIDMVHVSKLSVDQLRHQLEVDVLGLCNVVIAALGSLRATCGSIVALSTSATTRTATKDVLSATPKAAVEAFIRQVASEEGRFGVRANAVAVGPITDGMFHQLVADGYFTDSWMESAKANTALKRLGTASDVAKAVRFLASEESSWITGQVINVDGGYTA